MARPAIVEFIVHRQRAGVDDSHIEPRLDGVVQNGARLAQRILTAKGSGCLPPLVLAREVLLIQRPPR